MANKKGSLEVELTQQKPHKIYKIDIEFDYQIKELCKFIRNNKDKDVSIVVNGKHTKFNSFVGKKRFASGYEQGSYFVSKHAKKLFEEMQGEINVLKEKLFQTTKQLSAEKDKLTTSLDRLRTNDTVREIRQAAYADSVQELNNDRAILKERLDKVEPIIKLVVEASNEGQLQMAYKLAKKLTRFHRNFWL